MKELDVSLRDLAFPFPEPDARAQLWQRLIPQEAPVAPDLDLDELARRFELSGGFIRNIVLRGAFLAAREGAPISRPSRARRARRIWRPRSARRRRQIGLSNALPCRSRLTRHSMDDLIAAIAASPDDDAPRLVWADREGGKRGELAVLQCRIAAREGTRADRVRWQARVRELVAQEPDELTYVRGFVEEVTVELDALGPSLFEQFPLLRSLEIEPFLPSVRPSSYGEGTPDDAWAAGSARFVAACANLPVGRVQSLEVTAEISERGDHVEPDDEHPFGDQLVALIAETPAFSALRELRVIGGGLTAAVAPHVHASGLVALHGGARLDGASAARLLVEAPALRRFGPWNSTPRLAGVELAALLAAPATRELVALDLWANELGDTDLERLAATPFRHLERLSIGMGRFSDRGLAALAASPHLTGLRDLDLYIYGSKVAVSPVPFLRAPFALTHLRLGAVDDAIVAALEAAPTLEHVYIEPLAHEHLVRLRATIPFVNDARW